MEKQNRSPHEEGVTLLRRRDMAQRQRSPWHKISPNGAH